MDRKAIELNVRIKKRLDVMVYMQIKARSIKKWFLKQTN